MAVALDFWMACFLNVRRVGEWKLHGVISILAGVSYRWQWVSWTWQSVIMHSFGWLSQGRLHWGHWTARAFGLCLKRSRSFVMWYATMLFLMPLDVRILWTGDRSILIGKGERKSCWNLHRSFDTGWFSYPAARWALPNLENHSDLVIDLLDWD